MGLRDGFYRTRLKKRVGFVDPFTKSSSLPSPNPCPTEMAGRKRHWLPLLLLVSLSALFFFTCYHSSVPFSSPDPNPNPNFILRPQNPYNPNFTFIVKVLAYNRLDSLSRCLRSLAAADYLSDRVHLHVHIDHFALGDAAAAPPPPDDVDRKLHESRRILEFVDRFEWMFGDKVVHYRTANVGLQAQWLEAWWPSSDHEFAFVVEDDLEVSPLYYKFLRSLIVNYYYNASNFRPYIYGASLQRPRFVPGTILYFVFFISNPIKLMASAGRVYDLRSVNYTRIRYIT